MNRLSVQRAADASSLCGWDRLEKGASFYASARWLAYADLASGASSDYLVARLDGQPMAALSLHRAAGGFGSEYDPAAVIPEAGLIPETVLLGGYRGYRSSVLRSSSPDAAAALLRMIDEGVQDAAWW